MTQGIDAAGGDAEMQHVGNAPRFFFPFPWKREEVSAACQPQLAVEA
jgi:hypothetical protein